MTTKNKVLTAVLSLLLPLPGTTGGVCAQNPTARVSSEFKRGDTIMFQDNFMTESIGKAPSKWKLLDGRAAVRTFEGVKAMEITDNGLITPLINQQGAYLPGEFTIEYDFYYWTHKEEEVGVNDIKLLLANSNIERDENPLSPSDHAFELVHAVCSDENDEEARNYVEHNDGKKEDAEVTNIKLPFKQGWHHMAVSFNQGAMKVFADGKRIISLPKVQRPLWFCFHVPFDYEGLTYLRNVVLARGGIDLYERNLAAIGKSVQETGKFITNDILFDTGQATLKQESMEKIRNVAAFMEMHPDLVFEVQGHTDNQGSDEINDPLSQQRAETIVKALTGLGIDGARLEAVGKGSRVPVADNGTEAGRAKNRRVEFVKK